MKRLIVALGLCATSLCTLSQTVSSKIELVNKLLILQQPGIENMARALAQQPAMILMQRAGGLLQQQQDKDKREAAAVAIQADLKTYMDATVPILREDAVRLAPTAMGVILMDRFSEDELKQLIAIIESPVNRKFLALSPELQATLADQLVERSQAKVDPYIATLQNAVNAKLQAALPSLSAGAASPIPPATK